jgi:hypothetical protein
MRSTGLVVLTLSSTNNADTDACRKAQARYQDAVSAVSEMVRAYEKCVVASHGRDPCTTEFDDLDLAQDRFETTVSELDKVCREPASR